MPGDDVMLYRVGIVYASVCVPMGMSREVVETKANATCPTMIDSHWKICDDPTFRTGEPNPCQCDHNDKRLHYLLIC